MAGSVSDRHRTTAVGAFYAGIFSATDIEVGVEPVAGWLAGGDAYLNHWFDPNWAVQLDGNLRYYGPAEFYTGFPQTASEWALGGHLAYRDPDIGALGAFAALTQFTFTDTGSGYVFGPGRVGLLGVEAQAYLDDLTIYLQAGAALPSNEHINLNGTFWRRDETLAFVRGVIRYFPQDNIRLSSEAMLAKGAPGLGSIESSPDPVGFADTTILTGRLEAAYRPDQGQVSYFAAAEGVYNELTYAGVTRSQSQLRGMVGLRFDIGAETLKSRDREGVTFDLPRVADAIGTGNDISFCVESDCSGL